MIDPEISQILDGTPIAHVATVLPDGSPHSVPVWIGTHDGRVVFFTGPDSRKARNLHRDPRVAISLTRPDNPFHPVTIRGTVDEWLDGDAGWAVIDAISQKYVGAPYPRDATRVAALITPTHHTNGLS
jgi:PPOX class probable F420-dependent enzyme